MATLDDKMLALSRDLGNLDHGIRKMQSQDPGPWTWDVTMKAVRQTEAALKEVRAAVRARMRKEKRASCPHPEKMRDQTGKCGTCGAPGLDPAPARALCVCGHPRYSHLTDDLESCSFIHGSTTGTPDCNGFKMMAGSVLSTAAKALDQE